MLITFLKYLNGKINNTLNSQEMELLYDLKGHMEQLQREMSELRKSIQSCVERQMNSQNYLKVHEVHPGELRKPFFFPGNKLKQFNQPNIVSYRIFNGEFYLTYTTNISLFILYFFVSSHPRRYY